MAKMKAAQIAKAGADFEIVERDIPQERFEANAKDKAAQKAAFDKMLGLVPDVKEGSTLTFTYVPGKGTTLQVADKELGAFEGKGFADAVFSIWLGPKPPSEDLRKGMLG